MIFSSFVGVDLSGTQNLGTMPIAVAYGMQSGSSGYVLEEHALFATATPDEYKWEQIEGAEGTSSISGSSSSRIGSDSDGYITERTSSRDEITTWRRLTPRTDHWTDGGQSSEDFFVNSAQGTHTSEALSFPLPHGAALTGNSHHISNQTIVTESHFGRVFGSGAVAPDDPSDPKLAKKSLPTVPTELGSAGGGGSGSFTIVPGTEYGFISVANSGNTDSGFNLAGIYDVDSSGTSPDVATRILSSSATSGFGNHLESGGEKGVRHRCFYEQCVVLNEARVFSANHSKSRHAATGR